MIHMTNEEVVIWLDEYGDRGYEDLPAWLKAEMLARNLTWRPRKPTELEMWETVKDAREHRIVNKQLDLKDYIDKYVKNKDIETIT